MWGSSCAHETLLHRLHRGKPFRQGLPGAAFLGTGVRRKEPTEGPKPAASPDVIRCPREGLRPSRAQPPGGWLLGDLLNPDLFIPRTSMGTRETSSLGSQAQAFQEDRHACLPTALRWHQLTVALRRTARNTLLPVTGYPQSTQRHALGYCRPPPLNVPGTQPSHPNCHGRSSPSLAWTPGCRRPCWYPGFAGHRGQSGPRSFSRAPVPPRVVLAPARRATTPF